ncbi:MAG: hypothetical protein KTR31_02250 [Myxococcales bacterium]|nr:hypothetical protein [Myxococcales bacterium]
MLWSSTGASASEPLRGPIEAIEHPRYEDANGVPVHWREVMRLARGSEARRRVRSRRFGRTVLRVVFAGATTLEAYGAWRLNEQGSPFAIPLGVQASMTGAAGVLLWTSTRQRAEDRALILRGANSVLVPGRYR